MTAALLGLLIGSVAAGEPVGTDPFDLADVATFAGCLAGNSVVPAAGCLEFDLDFDGDVDLVDVSRVQHAFGLPIPLGMSLIPGGPFQMGDTFDEGNTNDQPVHSVHLTRFYIDRYEVTKGHWDAVRDWAMSNGYDLAAGSGKAADHPVQTVNWFECVKWCNARSEKEGRTPCYYTNARLGLLYRTGWVAPYVNWEADGYRLPTEAEWEKASRGGSARHRFPWSDTDTIQHTRANYFSSGGGYDTSLTLGHHPAFSSGGYPYTNPVGYFAPNGFGLYDMAVNVVEMCNDWFLSSYYSSSPETDPRGPASGTDRVWRGGSWNTSPSHSRCSIRGRGGPSGVGNTIGFRCAARAP